MPGGIRAQGPVGGVGRKHTSGRVSATTWSVFLDEYLCAIFVLVDLLFCFLFFSCTIILSAYTKALSFTKLFAAELGQKMLQWGAADWNQGSVNTYRVQKSKKNKGKKRVWWQHEVKAYHAGQGKGSGKSSKGLDQEVGAGYPDAPWWKPPTEEEKEEEDKEKEDEVEFVEPLVKKSKRDDRDDEGDSCGGVVRFPKNLGP